MRDLLTIKLSMALNRMAIEGRIIMGTKSTSKKKILFWCLLAGAAVIIAVCHLYDAL